MEKERIEKTKINNKLPVAREGIPFIIPCFIFTAVLFYFKFKYPGIFFGLLTLFITYFFRDPDRVVPNGDNLLVSPADGKVIACADVEKVPYYSGGCKKVSIFMSVFNVHVNRIPMSGRVSEIVYNRGKFFSANLDKASEQNENNRITLETNNGRKIVFVQIAGLIARRIVCWIQEQDYVKVGQRCGLIRFGSRLDIYIPADSRIIIQPRDRVKAGETIIGYLS